MVVREEERVVVMVAGREAVREAARAAVKVAVTVEVARVAAPAG